MRFLLPSAWALALMISSADAADNSVAVGAGVASCVTWTQVRNDPTRTDRDGAEQWVLGYVSGVSAVTPLKRAAADGVWAWMDKYCRDHPLDNISEAGVALIRQFPRAD